MAGHFSIKLFFFCPSSHYLHSAFCPFFSLVSMTTFPHGLNRGVPIRSYYGVYYATPFTGDNITCMSPHRIPFPSQASLPGGGEGWPGPPGPPKKTAANECSRKQKPHPAKPPQSDNSGASEGG
ncbi:hypothetical protein BKA66DRAFT_325152 [Pyrenochaeta sp. MPI-SDFR-AT-0127]|nr:hypothetical protein BKA66DRAFT_325152 [Pyrenochaeta sp. MPI-SDFR-AT-0127]